ncbi:hypothetical protein B0H21DRAFT_566730 [Amylocystis lapponica]|nr:hypothetical protein B0H21DRAFT_566730 [Amylocystis lapponica]
MYLHMPVCATFRGWPSVLHTPLPIYCAPRYVPRRDVHCTIPRYPSAAPMEVRFFNEFLSFAPRIIPSTILAASYSPAWQAFIEHHPLPSALANFHDDSGFDSTAATAWASRLREDREKPGPRAQKRGRACKVATPCVKDEMWTRPECERVIKNETKTINRHMVIHARELPEELLPLLYCELCGKAFESRRESSVQRHMTQSHPLFRDPTMPTKVNAEGKTSTTTAPVTPRNAPVRPHAHRRGCVATPLVGPSRPGNKRPLEEEESMKTHNALCCRRRR